MTQQNEQNTDTQLTTTNASNDLFLTDALSALNMPTSPEEHLDKSMFIRSFPSIKKSLLAINDSKRAIEFVQMVDQFYYSMQSDKIFDLPEIKVVKNPQNAERFEVGTIQVAQESTSKKSIEFYPLLYFKERKYWKKFERGVKPVLYCCSDNSNYGMWMKDTPYVRECESCPMRQWNSQEDGTISPKPFGSGTPPLCQDFYVFLGVTPALNTLYKVVLNRFCLSAPNKKDKGTQDKLIEFGRVMEPFIPDLSKTHDNDDVVKFMRPVCLGQVDMTSKWVDFSAEPVLDKITKAVTSARSICKRTDKDFTHLDMLLTSILRKMAVDYYGYTARLFLNRLKRNEGASVLDTNNNVVGRTSATVVSTTVVDDDLSDIDIDTN
jgi:hypothetical protein